MNEELKRTLCSSVVLIDACRSALFIKQVLCQATCTQHPGTHRFDFYEQIDKKAFAELS
ncbi:MAG: hypothetical protein PHZ02_04375 [Desulfocapsaceae bacterium]|nr:hypothetical protein [Desulfocapsaceae bacterium]